MNAPSLIDPGKHAAAYFWIQCAAQIFAANTDKYVRTMTIRAGGVEVDVHFPNTARVLTAQAFIPWEDLETEDPNASPILEPVHRAIMDALGNEEGGW